MIKPTKEDYRTVYSAMRELQVGKSFLILVMSDADRRLRKDDLSRARLLVSSAASYTRYRLGFKITTRTVASEELGYGIRVRRVS